MGVTPSRSRGDRGCSGILATPRERAVRRPSRRPQTRRRDSMTRTVLITGASTGIGEATALHLDSRGWRVFAGVRKPADATRLQDQASPGLTTLLLDVTDTASIQAAAATVAAQNAGRLDALVANAGISGGDPLEFAPLDSVRTMLDVNVVGVVATIQAFTDQVRAARGRIVCTGSIGGR